LAAHQRAYRGTGNKRRHLSANSKHSKPPRSLCIRQQLNNDPSRLARANAIEGNWIYCRATLAGVQTQIPGKGNDVTEVTKNM
jgi:hypothetical protein